MFHIRTKGLTSLSHPVILLTVPRRCFFCGSFLLFMFHFFLCYAVVSVPCRLVVPAGKGLACWLSCVLCFLAFLSLSKLVFRDRYSTWLYRSWSLPSSLLLMKLNGYTNFIGSTAAIKWASSWQNLSSGFPKNRDSNQSSQLQRLAREVNFRM